MTTHFSQLRGPVAAKSPEENTMKRSPLQRPHPMQPRCPLHHRHPLNHLASIAIAALLGVASASAAAVTCTWTGSNSGAWSVPANWTCPQPTGPSTNDDLVFPDGALNTSMTNDIPLLTINSMSFTGPTGGYTLAGNGNLTISGAAAITSKATGNNQNALALTNPLKFGAATATVDTSTNALGKLLLNGPIDLNGSVLLFTWDSTVPQTLVGGVISGAGGIIAQGSGGDIGLTLSGNNTFTGPVTVEGGYLSANHVNALGAGGSAANGTVVKPNATFIIGADITNEFLSVEAGGGSNGNGNMQANGIRTWGGPVTLVANQNQSTITFNLLSNQIIFTGPISGSGGMMCCNETAGRIALANSANTYGGASAMSLNQGGTLRATANNTLSPASPIVLAGTTGGVLEMGAFSATSAGFTGSSASFLKISTGGKLTVNGPVSLANTTLQLTLVGNPANGTQFMIIDKTTAGAVQGTFNGLNEGATLNAGGLQFSVSYVGGNGNDVVLTVLGPVPPPTLTVVRNGSGTGSVASNGGFIVCSPTCSNQVPAGTPMTLSAIADPGMTFVGWSGPCSGNSTCQFTINSNTTVTATFTSLVLGKIADVDGNNAYDALTDGLLVIRHLFGSSGSSLTNNAIGLNATRSTPVQVAAYLSDIRPMLDIDGNGVTDAVTDGLMLVRYMFGLRGNALVAGAIGPNPKRTLSGDIEAYIATLMP